LHATNSQLQWIADAYTLVFAGLLTRELGATLGVAVVGSVFTSVYARQLAHQAAIAVLPTAARVTSTRSLAAAYQVAARLSPNQSHQVIAAANGAFLRR
jgi:hypothetical protein